LFRELASLASAAPSPDAHVPQHLSAVGTNNVAPSIACRLAPVLPSPHRRARALAFCEALPITTGMSALRLFATDLYRSSLAGEPGWADLNADLEAATRMLAEEDEAGRAWCREKGYAGYTSYASLNDLPRRATCFETLAARIRKHAAAFAGTLMWDLAGRRLQLDNLWVNSLAPGGAHSGHVHPHCVLSGTYYVRTPKGASAIKFEDPRHPLMMAAPVSREDAPQDRQRFVSIAPAPGDLLMWESWLRHEVPPNRARSERISISFNLRTG
jgi:uncharacterized protein (TIGR02466 family)